MGRLILTEATTKTGISAFVDNDNVDALLSTINGGLDGTYNLAAGAIGASGNSDLSSHIAGNGLALSGNQLSVGSGVLTNANFSSSANIQGSQFASNSISSLAKNCTSHLLNLLVSAVNASGGKQLKIIRGMWDPTSVLYSAGVASAGEGFSLTRTAAGGIVSNTLTFTTAFTTTPMVVGLSWITQGYIESLSGLELYAASISTTGAVIKSSQAILDMTDVSPGISFLIVGT